MKHLKPFQEFVKQKCEKCGDYGEYHSIGGKIYTLCERHKTIQERKQKLEKLKSI